MQRDTLTEYKPTAAMLKNDLGIGVITLYKLSDDKFYMIGIDYHNKGAISPTVGAKYFAEQTMRECLQGAFERKRFNVLQLDHTDISPTIFYSANPGAPRQPMARLTFTQLVESKLSYDEFTKTFIEPMHAEACYQGSVSGLFWRMDETCHPAKKDSKFKFTSDEERIKATVITLNNMTLSTFKVPAEIMAKLEAMKQHGFVWDDKAYPLEFYANHGGRKYSEVTGVFLMSVENVIQQLNLASLKIDPNAPDKQTVFITDPSLASQPPKKKFFFFEDEVKVVARALHDVFHRVDLSKIDS